MRKQHGINLPSWDCEPITQSELKEALTYDSITGIFIRRYSAGCGKKGSIPGCIKTEGYREIGLNGGKYYAHRLAWLYVYGEFPSNEIDHINGDPIDNRIVNLRAVTHKENTRNQPVRSNNKSGFIGVFWSKAGQQWMAQISVSGKGIHLGMFPPTFEGKMLALASRKNAEEKYGFHVNHGRVK